MSHRRITMEQLMHVAYHKHVTIEGMVSTSYGTFFYDWPLAHAGSPVHVDHWNQMLGRSARRSAKNEAPSSEKGSAK